MKYPLFLLLFLFFSIGSIKAEDVRIEMSWDSVSTANAYKPQYQVNGGAWNHINTTDTLVTFTLDLNDGDTVRGKVRGCFELNTPCPEGDFSRSASVTYVSETQPPPDRVPAPENLRMRILK